MQAINPQMLEMVKETVISELDNGIGLSESLVNTCGEDVARSLSEVCNSLQGVFSMLGLTGAENLCIEMVAVLDSWQGDYHQEQPAADQLHLAAQILPKYFDYVSQKGMDSPVLLTDEINGLRKISARKPVNEGLLLSGLLTAERVVTEMPAITEELLILLKRTRLLYQKGLLNLIRKQAEPAALRVMAYALASLWRGTEESQQKRYWQLVTLVVQAMSVGQLSISQQRLHLLMTVERQLAALIKGRTEIEHCFPEPLQIGMQVCLMLADSDGEAVRQLGGELGLDLALLSDREMQLDRARLSTDQNTNLIGLMVTLEACVGELRLMLDEIVQQSDKEIKSTPITELLNKMTELSTAIGLSKVVSYLTEHQQRYLHADFNDSTMVSELVDLVMYLECVLLQLAGQAPTEQQLEKINSLTVEEVIGSSMIAHAEKQVLQEAVKSLDGVMAGITGYCDGAADESVLHEQAVKFDVVSGASKILQLARAAAVAERCKNLFDNGLEVLELSNETFLETVADSVVSLQFYLDSRSRNQQVDDGVLAVAEESLQRLES